jgi:hypothetical protein
MCTRFTDYMCVYTPTSKRDGTLRSPSTRHARACVRLIKVYGRARVSQVIRVCRSDSLPSLLEAGCTDTRMCMRVTGYTCVLVPSVQRTAVILILCLVMPSDELIEDLIQVYAVRLQQAVRWRVCRSSAQRPGRLSKSSAKSTTTPHLTEEGGVGGGEGPQATTPRVALKVKALNVPLMFTECSLNVH